MKLSIWVPGVPVAKGSMSAFIRGARAVVVDQKRARVRPWSAAIRAAAEAAMTEPPADCALRVRLAFVLPRRKSAPRRLTVYDLAAVKPDVDKLTRCVLDALEGVAYTNDSRVVRLTVDKRAQEPGEATGVAIHVQPV